MYFRDVSHTHIVVATNFFSDLHKYQRNTFHLILVGCLLRVVPAFVTWLIITAHIFIIVVKKRAFRAVV